MGLIFNIEEKKSLKGKYVDPKVKICVDCGSFFVILKDNEIFCKNCGSSRKKTK